MDSSRFLIYYFQNDCKSLIRINWLRRFTQEGIPLG